MIRKVLNEMRVEAKAVPTAETEQAFEGVRVVDMEFEVHNLAKVLVALDE